MLERKQTLRILVVDDDDLVRRALARALRPHRVQTASDYTSAELLLRTDRFDLIISDHEMPGRSGLELLQLAQQLQPGATRVLASGNSSLELAEATRSGSVQRFIAKPWDPAKLRTLTRAP
jgi:DNA-binding NtrC family response regulator